MRLNSASIYGFSSLRPGGRHIEKWPAPASLKKSASHFFNSGKPEPNPLMSSFQYG
ncbi:MAG: hypothetical protein KGO81_15045 [Bacteroidota bacterium]|nr:hypothetical protein [Bacteroidota bacterium]